jgi:polyisoprenoid-binding protein YceI
VHDVSWQIDKSHSSAEFSVRHMGIATVRGRFEDLEGTFELEDGRPTRIEARIPAASVSTRDPQRDAHLKSADFFDVEHHPYITFASKRIEPQGDGRYRIVGDLTIRGTTHEVTLDGELTEPVKDPWGKQRIGFTAEGVVNRKDFGLTWNVVLETGGVLVSDQVRLHVSGEAVQA